MKRIVWPIAMGVALLAVSAGLYFLQLTAFHRPDETGFYLLQDLAFLPVQVLLVTIIFDRLMNRREQETRLNKMNMVIGAFFAEAGTELLRRLLAFDSGVGAISPAMMIQADWPPRRFAEAIDLTRRHAARIEFAREDLHELRRFLLAKRDFLLRLLENSNLLEHETFTDSLWAIFHLTDELTHRTDFKALPDADLRHLAIDLDRAYKRIMAEWLAYMRNLKRDYPYLFSLALRTNPFDPSARVEVG
jgi:hypothetical protein